MKILEGDINSFVKHLNDEMEKAIKYFEKELTPLRTGKATPSLLDNVMVDVHGKFTKLRELASISVQDARSIIVSPWEKTIIPNIQKAISNSELGIHPSIEGDALRLQLPMMSSERREEIVKQLSHKLEDAKVQMRNVRKDFNNKIKSAEKVKEVSEDYAKNLVDKIQKHTDEWIEKASAIAKKKEAELRLI